MRLHRKPRTAGGPVGDYRPVVVAAGRGWVAAVDRTFFEHLVDRAARSIPGIRAMQTRSVSMANGAVYLSCRAETGYDAHPGPIAADLRAALRQALDSTLSLRLGGIHLELSPVSSGRAMTYDLQG
jgi:hypothetical protein